MAVNVRYLRRPSKAPEPETAKPLPQFTPETLESHRKDMTSGQLRLKRIQISDDVQQGLRAMISSTGLITFHAHYDVDGDRPYLKVGHYPMNATKKEGQAAIDDARELTRIIRALGDRGIDPQAGLHERLMSELRKDKEKWRP